MPEQHPALAYLLAAHERAEKVARALPDGPWQWRGHNGPEGRYMALEGPAEVPALRSRSKDEVGSWLEWHPAFDEFLPESKAVLRRVAADRRILAEHQPERTASVPVHETCRDLSCDCYEDIATCGTCAPGHYYDADPQPWPCATVLDLAAGWGWKAGT